ncbi:hypothetical protein EC991_006687 [Linnemannia zychae]|nr:hypothetical protein EC991_006687 [Linnemannia zychae]
MIVAALVMSLSLITDAAPAAAPADAPAAAPGDVSATGIIDATLWPLGFTNQCNALAAITAGLDKQIARAKSKNYSCTAAQTKIIQTDAKCSPLSIVTSLIWPIAFAQQESLSKRIAAQVECLAGYR